jgi:hypothetical protein
LAGSSGAALAYAGDGWGTVFLAQNDEWALTRRYMSVESLGRIVGKPVLSLPGMGN